MRSRHAKSVFEYFRRVNGEATRIVVVVSDGPRPLLELDIIQRDPAKLRADRSFSLTPKILKRRLDDYRIGRMFAEGAGFVF
jgi:hypothetical protein